MATEILMPALSPTMEEGTLAKWLVKEGDEVKSGQILAEIETDKATMEFEAVDEGKIGKILIAEGKTLARAAWSPASQIRARVWSFDAEAVIDHAFFKRAVAASVARRAAIPALREQQGVRLIHGESDGLPGVIADRYGDVVVLQLTSAGADKWREAIVAGLVQATGCAAEIDRVQAEVLLVERGDGGDVAHVEHDAGEGKAGHGGRADAGPGGWRCHSP